MKRKAEEQQQWADNGHGVMTKITDQKMFFDVSKGSEKVPDASTPSRNRLARLSRAYAGQSVTCRSSSSSPATPTNGDQS